jgi:hypothetical protein
MALPPRLAKYDALLDLMVEQFVREVTTNANKKPAASCQTSPRAGDQLDDENTSVRAPDQERDSTLR